MGGADKGEGRRKPKIGRDVRSGREAWCVSDPSAAADGTRGVIARVRTRKLPRIRDGLQTSPSVQRLILLSSSWKIWNGLTGSARGQGAERCGTGRSTTTDQSRIQDARILTRFG